MRKPTSKKSTDTEKDKKRKAPAKRSKKTSEKRTKPQAEQRIRTVLDAAAEAIVTVDPSRHIETFNPAAERMFGYAAENAAGRKIDILVTEPFKSGLEAYLRRCREAEKAGKRMVPREVAARRKDGTVFPIELSTGVIDDLDMFTLIMRDLTEQKALQREVLRIAALEQQRIGRELHDSTQQELTGLGLLAQNLSDALAGEDTVRSELAGKLAKGIAETNRNVHAIAKGLLPIDVPAKSLGPALSDLAQSTSRECPLHCRFECPHPVKIADDVTAMHLYRIAREAVTNAVKHADPENVTIRLTQADSTVILEVVDDGVGVDVSVAEGGLGLRTMAYRCSLIGGTLDVDAAKGAGTRVVCAAPLRMQH